MKPLYLVGLHPGDLRRFDEGEPLAGEIKPGQVYAWEPRLAHAACLLVVTEVKGEMVHARDIDGDRVYYNDDSRFREACVRTIMRDHPVRRNVVPPPLLDPPFATGVA